MKRPRHIEPIGHLNAHAAETLRPLDDRRGLVVTQNDEAETDMQDIESSEQTQRVGIGLKNMRVYST